VENIKVMKYPLRILTIKIWEWEGIIEKSELSIAANGPNSFDCENFETAVSKIKELKEAVLILERDQSK
jgi:hypothetical protein